MRFSWSIAAAVLVVAFLFGPHADLRPSSAHAQSYELERVEKVLADEKLEIDPAPEGKIIDFVRIVRHDVFVDDEIWPTWFNMFHGLTRDSIVRREVLLAPGETYVDARVEESMRNLRGMGIFALVHIEAVKTPQPGHVGLLVHTRDVWSLRIEEDFNITQQVNYLLVRLTERNIAGRNHSLGVDFEMVPKRHTYRLSHGTRRVAGSRIRIGESAALYVGSDRGKAEGMGFGANVDMPLYRLAERHGFELNGGYTTRVERSVRDGEVYAFTPVMGGPSALRVYRRNSASAAAIALIRRGDHVKRSSRVGLDFRELETHPTAETELPVELADAFARYVMPRQRREIGPTATYSIWLTDYHTFSNLAAYGVSENVHTGPTIAVGGRLPLRAFGSNSDSFVLAGDLGYVFAKSGGLLEVSVGASGRYEGRQWVDRVLSGLIRGATPPFGGFRLVARASMEERRRDTANTVIALGGNNGLRGYPSQALFGNGASYFLGNVELRTPPLEWQAIHLGGVAFYDVGSVYQGLAAAVPYHAVGVGLRLFFPQFNRYPFSADLGAPIDPGFRIVPTVTTGQVVRLTSNEEG